jgi:hypothetical protein
VYDIWDKYFYFIKKENIAPLLFGEFGITGEAAANPSSTDYRWFTTFMEYVGLAPQGFDTDAADVTCDGSIDIIDALRIAQYYVGLVTSFCQGYIVLPSFIGIV